MPADPLPAKITVDTAIGSEPVPAFLAPPLPDAASKTVLLMGDLTLWLPTELVAIEFCCNGTSMRQKIAPSDRGIWPGYRNRILRIETPDHAVATTIAGLGVHGFDADARCIHGAEE